MKVPEQFRINHPVLGIGEGNNGAFVFKKNGVGFYCIASDGGGWDHVSVSLDKKRCPDWEEMCMIKEMFWDSQDCVIQFHPPESEYVNNHEYCLHLWKPQDFGIPIPPSYFVGFK